MEKLTVMDLHYCLGAIAPRAMRELVSNGRLTAIVLVPPDEPEICDVRICVKSMHKPAPNARESGRD